MSTIAERQPDWSAKLKQISSGPLELCPDFPQIAQRWEDWWEFKADRPLLVCSAPKTRDIPWDKGLDIIHQPAKWLAHCRRQVENKHYVGEAIPHIRADFGPVVTAAFLGAPMTLSQAEQTSWQTPIIEDWDNFPAPEVDRDNEWLKLSLELFRLIAEDGAGRYVACLPDLTGAIDALANMRDPQRLCLDLFEHRAQVIAAAGAVVDAWEEIFCLMYDVIIGAGTGVIQWLGCWSNRSYTLPTCDFNFLIGHQDFQEVCLPSLAEQARRATRCCFHLDGPGASRHAEALANDPAITAVQYTPGAGTPSAVAKLDMYKMIQATHTPLLVMTPEDEIEQLIGELDPAGLVLLVGAATPQEADRHMQRIQRAFP